MADQLRSVDGTIAALEEAEMSSSLILTSSLILIGKRRVSMPLDGCSTLGVVQPDQPTRARRAATGCTSVSGHIANNAAAIINYSERWHNGERISTAFVESMVNLVISRRRAKKQQMQ